MVVRICYVQKPVRKEILDSGSRSGCDDVFGLQHTRGHIYGHGDARGIIHHLTSGTDLLLLARSYRSASCPVRTSSDRAGLELNDFL